MYFEFITRMKVVNQITKGVVTVIGQN